MKFRVNGDYVTQNARRMYWEDRETFEQTKEYLLNFLGGNSTPEELNSIVVLILEGKKRLDGVNNFSLEDDDECLGKITDDENKARLDEAFDKIKNHMAFNIKNYIDFYALDKSWMFFVGFTPDQAYQYAYTDASAIARAMNSYDVQITTSFLSVKPSEPLDLSHYYDDSIKDFLDHGAYLVYNPELIKEIMGKPVLTSDIPEFYEKLYEYWENSKFKSHPRVRLRQERYLKSKQICSGSAIKDVVKNDFVDDINTGVPDVIKSKYGIIDREGRWYNSDWGNHSYVASLIINNNPGLFNVDKATIDDALDIIVNRGYLLIRDVTNCHKPKLFHKSFIHPNSYQEDMIDKYLSHFNISESLEYETTYYY